MALQQIVRHGVKVADFGGLKVWPPAPYVELTGVVDHHSDGDEVFLICAQHRFHAQRRRKFPLFIEVRKRLSR